MGAELLNCPCCHGQPAFVHFESGTAVRCETCGLQSAESSDDHGNLAATLWNRRTPPQAAQGDASAVTRNLRAGVDTAPPRAEVSEELLDRAEAAYDEAAEAYESDANVDMSCLRECLRAALTAAMSGGD